VTPRKKILVSPTAEFDAHRAFFRLLSALYPANFIAAPPNSPVPCDGAILWAQPENPERPDFPCDTLIIAAPATERIDVTDQEVRFGKCAWLEQYFRQQTMREHGIPHFPPLRLAPGDEPVCTLNGQHYWLARAAGDHRISTVALGPPNFSEGHTVYHHFNRLTWLRLLPFLHFIKGLTRREDWAPPPLRACLMIDDPNLHRSSYGYIDFKTLARHAADHNYHAAMAMVPCDAWYFDDEAARLFRRSASRLSLLMHGNNHGYLEYGTESSSDAIDRPLAQALRRIQDFERRSGLDVARVMAPPYGAFWAGMADPMLRLGYEAVCVSRSSLKSWNGNVQWPLSFGHSPTEFLNDGFPVIPRQALARDQEDGYRLAAFLDQPIIPHGHHQDFREGFGLIERAVQTINSLGSVVWSDMASLSRSNYQTLRSGHTLRLRMHARQVTLPAVEAGIQNIIVERPWIDDHTQRPEVLICQQAATTRFYEPAHRTSYPIDVSGPDSLTLLSPPQQKIDPARVPSPAFAVWPLLRRTLSEARDRLSTVLPGQKRWAA
jgi:hypothetical protein